MNEQELAEKMEDFEKAIMNCARMIDELTKNTLTVLGTHHQALLAMGIAIEELQREKRRKLEDFYDRLMLYAEQTQERLM